MKTMLSLIILFPIPCTTYSQVNDQANVWEFYNQIEEAAAKSCNENCDSVDRFVFDKQFFTQNTASYGLDTSSKYQLMFIYENGWKHVIGQESGNFKVELFNANSKKTTPIPEQINEPKTEIIPTDFRKFNDDFKTYSGNELHQNLMIEDSLFNNTTHLNAFPIIHQRHDPQNMQWLPISSGNYLILRYVHSYPDGNMTSFYYEKIIYLKKVK